jgi:6-phosphogluconolactonase (cycloisomerase 2 family)
MVAVSVLLLSQATPALAVGPRFLYVTSRGDGAFEGFAINASTGALTRIGSLSWGSPNSITVEPSGRFVYATTNYQAPTGNVAMLSIGPTGILTPGPFARAGEGPRAVTAHPSGRYLYVVNSLPKAGNSVSVYEIDLTSGVLTPLETVPAGDDPWGIAVPPSGRFAVVANYGYGNDVSVYTIGANGRLKSLGKVGTGGLNPASVAVHPSGHFVYVANRGSADVSMFTIDTNWMLKFLGKVSAGLNPRSVTVDDSGRFAYVANEGSDTLSMYAIGANGLLTPKGIVNTGRYPYQVVSSGPFVYVVNYGAPSSSPTGSVSPFMINTAGGLTEIGPPVRTTVHHPNAIAIAGSSSQSAAALGTLAEILESKTSSELTTAASEASALVQGLLDFLRHCGEEVPIED